jgi:hypothetical protein
VSGEIEVEPAGPNDREAWEAVVARASNGTLFHDLDFLDYHPPGRFELRHLLIRRGGEVIGALPAAAVAQPDGGLLLKSPYGASVGGPALVAGLSDEAKVEVMRRLSAWASGNGFSAIELRLGPPVYDEAPGEGLSFGLFAAGYRVSRSWLCHMIPLSDNPEAVMDGCTRGKARDIRAGLRRGAVPREGAEADLEAFFGLMSDTYRRLGSTPTHSPEEIRDLFLRTKGKVRVFLCEKDGEPLAGVLLFVLNARVAYTFYICQAEAAPADLNANAVLVTHVAERLAAEGFRYLDLGPSTFDDGSFNRGVAFFKEGLGGRGWRRDLWRLDLA